MQEFQEQLLLSINSELQLRHTKRGLFCSPVFACVCFQTRLSHFISCCFAHARGALCKHLQASCSIAPFEISCAGKAAKTWQGGSVGDLVSVSPPLLRCIFSEVSVLPLFFLPPRVFCCMTSLEKEAIFFFYCYYWFIWQQGQPTLNPMAVALHIIEVQVNKFV